MEKRPKRRLLQVWGICGLCLCALLAGVWFILDDATPRLRLVEEVDCVGGGEPVVVCRMSNPSAKFVYHGTEFRVERWNEDTSAWEEYHEEGRNFNFTLPLLSLAPLGSKTVEYPAYYFAEHFAVGRYRVAQKVRCSGFRDWHGGEETTLYCEFSITAP